MQSVVDVMAVRMSTELKSTFTPLMKRAMLSPPVDPLVVFDDITDSLPYQDGTSMFKTSTHIGQRKLFLSELQFLTNEIPAGEPATVVYAGAAPSNHTGFLSDLFPHIKFILVDPNAFDIYGAKPIVLQPIDGPEMNIQRARDLIEHAHRGNDKLYIINDLFTLDLANAIAEIIPYNYFISDIRTNTIDSGEPDSLDILWNLSQQYNWMCIMDPVRSMLKFRHPFYNDNPKVFMEKCMLSPYVDDFELSRAYGIDFVENFKTRELVYWNGTINLQAWCGSSSTEARLVTDCREIKNWGTSQEYEDRYFYYNTIERCYRPHKNRNANPSIGFDHCNDCALENHVWVNYLDAYPHMAPHGGVCELVAKLSHNTHRPLSRGDHGAFFKMYPTRLLFDAAQEHNRALTSKQQPQRSLINPKARFVPARKFKK